MVPFRSRADLLTRWNTPGWRLGVAWGGTVLALWLLFWPFKHEDGRRSVPGFDKAVHVAVFGGLAWAWGRVSGADDPSTVGRRNRWRLAAALAVATVLVEVLQPLTGRGFDLLDSLAGCAGIAAVTLSWGHGFWTLAFAVTGLAGMCMGRGAWHMGTEWRAFPTLAGGGGGCWAEAWLLRGVEGEPTGDGLRLVPLPEGPDTWRGAFRVPMRSDWRAWGDWKLRVEWGGAEEATLVVRLDDRRKKEPAYDDRFQCEWRVVPGWNELTIPHGEWTKTSGGGKLDVSDIARWGVFLLEPADFDHWTLGKTELITPKERPTR